MVGGVEIKNSTKRLSCPFVWVSRKRDKRYSGARYYLVSPHVLIEKANAGKRALLCFNVSDYETDVWVNGIRAVTHKGGVAPFSIDITDYLIREKNVPVVRCFDIMETAVPRGKQSRMGEQFACYYYPNSGI